MILVYPAGLTTTYPVGYTSSMTKTEIIETLTEAGIDYHEFDIAAAAGDIAKITAERAEIEDPEPGETDPIEVSEMWEIVNLRARRESAPDLLDMVM